MAILKGNKHQLGLFFLLEACQRNAAGWSTAVWPANANFPLPHRRTSITRPCCSIERSSAKLLVFYMHFEASRVERSTGSDSVRVRTRRRVGSTRRRGNHMHDHSRFQRDINDVTGVSLSLSLSLSQKSLTHNIGSASALPIITVVFSDEHFAERHHTWKERKGRTIKHYYDRKFTSTNSPETQKDSGRLRLKNAGRFTEWISFGWIFWNHVK